MHEANIVRKPVVVRAEILPDAVLCLQSDGHGLLTLRPGDWIYRQPGGAVIRVTDAEFRANYEVVMDDVDEVDGSVAIYGVSYP